MTVEAGWFPAFLNELNNRLLDKAIQYRLEGVALLVSASKGLITPPCGVPRTCNSMEPSENWAGALSQRRKIGHCAAIGYALCPIPKPEFHGRIFFNWSSRASSAISVS